MALVTVDDLELHLQRTIKAADTASAQAAIDWATAAVFTELGGDPQTWITAEQYQKDVVAAVIVRAAATWFVNPQDRASFSGPDGMAFSPSPALLSRVISPADLELLMRVKLAHDPGFG